MSDQINLSLRNFRSIESADIALNGITVVTGINGCGKSTISRTLYRLIRLSANYESVLLQRSKKIDPEWTTFDRILNLVMPRSIPRYSSLTLVNKNISSYKDLYLEYVDLAIKKAENINPEKSAVLADKIRDIELVDEEATLIQILESLKEKISKFLLSLEK